MANESIGSLFGIADPMKNQNTLQRYLGEFDEVECEVTLGVEIEWETDQDSIADVVNRIRSQQDGLTIELISQWYPGHRIDPNMDHLMRLKAAITNRLIMYHEEASLVNGLEIVLGPANSRLMRLLVESVLLSSTGFVSSSDRCSTHVHMNVCDLTMKQLGVMTLLYPFIEELLFKWVDPNRWHNPFTRPWCTDAQHEASPRKYQAMNIVPSGCRLDMPFGDLVLSDVGRNTIGTIEFRHFPGLTSRNVLSFFHWLDFIEEFRSVCLANTREKIIQTFQPLASTSGYVEVLRQLFPLSSAHWLSRFGYNEVQAFMSGPVAAFRRHLGKDTESKAYRNEFSLATITKSVLADRLLALPARPSPESRLLYTGSFATAEQLNQMSRNMERAERVVRSGVPISFDEIELRATSANPPTAVPPPNPRVATPRPQARTPRRRT